MGNVFASAGFGEDVLDHQSDLVRQSTKQYHTNALWWCWKVITFSSKTTLTVVRTYPVTPKQWDYKSESVISSMPSLTLRFFRTTKNMDQHCQVGYRTSVTSLYLWCWFLGAEQDFSVPIWPLPSVEQNCSRKHQWSRLILSQETEVQK